MNDDEHFVLTGDGIRRLEKFGSDVVKWRTFYRDKIEELEDRIEKLEGRINSMPIDGE
jgi:hypothetical protein